MSQWSLFLPVQMNLPNIPHFLVVYHSTVKIIIFGLLLIMYSLPKLVREILFGSAGPLSFITRSRRNQNILLVID